MGYLGCGTVANKIGWALVALLLLVGGIMLAVGLAKAVPCSRTLVACNNAARGAAPAVKACNTAFRDCARTHFIVAGAGLVVAIVGLSIVCCMCCCARRPAPKQLATGQPYGAMTGAVQMGPAGMQGPHGQQQQQPYGAYNPYAPPGPPQQQQQQQPGSYNPYAPAAPSGQYAPGPPPTYTL